MLFYFFKAQPTLVLSGHLKKRSQPGMVAYTFNPIHWNQKSAISKPTKETYWDSVSKNLNTSRHGVNKLSFPNWVAESGSVCKFKASLVYNAIWEQPGLHRGSPNSNKTKRCPLSLHQNINVLYYSILKGLYNSSISNRHSLLYTNIQNYSYKSEILNKNVLCILS